MVSFLGGSTVLVLVIAVLAIFKGVRQVPQGSVWTVERFGKYTRSLAPGLNLIIPFVESVEKASIKEQVLDIPSQSVITKDNASVKADAVIFYQIVDPKKAIYQVENLTQSLAQQAMSQLRAVLGGMELDEILSKRGMINTTVQEKISASAIRWGITINNIEVKELSPPADLVEAMEKQMKSTREKRANIIESEGLKEAAVNVAEGEKKAAQLTADGELYAAQKAAEGRIAEARAEAGATKLVSEAISTGNPQAIQYFVAQEYFKSLGALAASENNSTMIMPIEFSGVAGAVAGVSELLSAVKK